MPSDTDLQPGDIPDALALSDAAGWNQTADDWAFFVRHGAIGRRDAATGRVVATAASLAYGAVAWVSMVLVAAERRHEGLASALVAESIAGVRARGLVPVLDATPAGRPVYAALGFEGDLGFERWERSEREGDRGRRDAPVDGDPEVDAVAALDLAASGLDRRDWFADVLRRPGSSAVRDGADGFALVRAGRRARQIGPVVAGDERAALSLVDRALARVGAARVFIDVPVARVALTAHLQRAGFARQRPFTRMAQGALPPPLGARQFAFAGPEFG